MTTWWAAQAWVDAAWQRGVLLEAGTDGLWRSVQPGAAEPPAHAAVLSGPALPGLVNAHSHAFQRAFAGLAERHETLSPGDDDFWSWRDRMYQVALRITPRQLRAVAAQLYTELLRGGYTQVCEFHYLQHAPDGSRYDDPLELSWMLADAAAQAGIGLTVLPVLYQRAGFARPALRDDQRRFAATPQFVWDACEALQRSGRPLLNAGLAIHSLRAASADDIAALLQMAHGMAGPIHLHIAEQTAEVQDCLAATGARPIDWLCRTLAPDARWQLVHATHALPQEIEAVARCGAGVVLCPGTEANLGDGHADLPRWLAAGVPLAIGSDSQVTRAWPEELRWLEYGQRLLHQRRNMAAAPAHGMSSTAERLFSCILAGGAAAAGHARWGLQPGARADMLVLDPQEDALLGIPAQRLLDALVFSSPGTAIQEVYVAGQCVVRHGQHVAQPAISRAFEQAMHELWDDDATLPDT